MKCKSCKREIPDESIFCLHCGEKVVRNRSKKKELSVPKPRQLPSGTWFAQLTVGGERVSVSAETESAYYAKAKAIKAGLIEVKKKPVKMTVSDAIDLYLAGKQNRLQEKTKQQYKYIRDNRFSTLMNLPVSEVTSAVVDAAIDAELDKPSRKGGTVKPKTVIDAYALVATALKKVAPDIKLDVSLPELQRSLVFVMPPEDIYPAIKGTDIELPCLLAMWLGMSMSEIRGLTKSKSLRGDKLYIVETVVDLNEGPLRKSSAKEEHRKRVYDIPPYIKGLIDAVEGDVIEPRSGHAVYMRFQHVLANNGLPHMTFHALRHVNASVMAEEFIPAVVAQERNGWKTDYTMKKVYTHAFQPSRLEADKKMDNRFNKIVGFAVENAESANEITNGINSP